MKKLCMIFCVFLFLFALNGCTDQEINPLDPPDTDAADVNATVAATTPESMIGEYICRNDTYNAFIAEYPEYIPSINFYDDGACKLRVYYIGGVTDVFGIYEIKKNEIHVKVDLSWTIFEGTDDAGLPYMDDEYIFTITDEEHLTIDREYYTVHAGDPFERISAEPETTTGFKS